MALYRRSFLLYPFTEGAAFAVAAIAVAASQARYGRLLYLLVPPAMFLPIVRGFGAGQAQSALPGLVARVRTETMDRGAGAATIVLVVLVVLGGFLGIVLSGLISQAWPVWGGILARCGWIAFAFQIAILVGLSLQGRVATERLLGRRPAESGGQS